MWLQGQFRGEERRGFEIIMSIPYLSFPRLSNKSFPRVPVQKKEKKKEPNEELCIPKAKFVSPTCSSSLPVLFLFDEAQEQGEMTKLVFGSENEES